MFGFLNVYKPKGITSHDVINKIRRIINIKQVGHTGTLDPFAEGVLPVCVGKATRLIEYLEDNKEYIASVQFGQNTDTYDLEGQVTSKFDKKISCQDVLSALNNFKGEIMQTPPIFSAVKVNGKKLYDYARAGKQIEVKPRKVLISNIELLDFDADCQNAIIRIACSKGTYIRSIAYELGKNLQCGAYLTNLVRTKAGMFKVADAVKLENLSSAEVVRENLIDPIKILNLKMLVIDDFEHKKVIQGQSLENKSMSGDDLLILIYNNKMDAVAFVEGDKIKVKKVFV